LPEGTHSVGLLEGELLMRIGIVADHGGFAMKVRMASALTSAGHDVIDFYARLDFLSFCL
jgi:hypothetical protein